MTIIAFNPRVTSQGLDANNPRVQVHRPLGDWLGVRAVDGVNGLITNSSD